MDGWYGGVRKKSQERMIYFPKLAQYHTHHFGQIYQGMSVVNFLLVLKLVLPYIFQYITPEHGFNI